MHTLRSENGCTQICHYGSNSWTNMVSLYKVYIKCRIWLEIYEEITDETSARQNGIIPAYVSSEDAKVMVQVGLSADIEPICNMMVKLSLMELSRGETAGITSLEDELVYNYYLWANRRDRKFANWYAMPGAGPMPTIMRWYGANISRREDCVVCSEKEIKLDIGNEIELINN